jgi:predicted metal-dependent HD superfamily phosphohydrolase
MSSADELSNWLASIPREWTAGCSDAVFAKARAAYETPARQYHNWHHIESCIAELASFRCNHPRTVFLALVFHDAVYVAGRTDNEAKSAELARTLLSGDRCVSRVELEAIDRMIRASRDHHAHASSADRDLAVMLDIDLSILGAARDEYQRYARAIHDEYVPSATTGAQFRIGRLEFLERTLAVQSLFITPEAAQRWNVRARANIAWEIDLLKSEQGLVERAVSAIRRQ